MTDSNVMMADFGSVILITLGALATNAIVKAVKTWMSKRSSTKLEIQGDGKTINVDIPAGSSQQQLNNLIRATLKANKLE